MTRVFARSVQGTPATLAYLVALAATSAVISFAGTHTADRLLLEVSTNLHQLARDPVRVLVGSAFWVGDWSSFVVWAALLVAVLGPVERRLGWRRTTVVFALGHVGATLLVAAGLWVALRLDAVDPGVAGARDVGASYGFLAVAAFATLLLPARPRFLLPAALAGYVTIAAVYSHTFTDFGHLLAAAIGFASYPLVVRPREQDGARDNEHERGHACGAGGTAGKPLAEERDAGSDRQRVREQGRESGGRQSAAALEAEL
jgi:hypothetical protein